MTYRIWSPVLSRSPGSTYRAEPRTRVGCSPASLTIANSCSSPPPPPLLLLPFSFWWGSGPPSRRHPSHPTYLRVGAVGCGEVRLGRTIHLVHNIQTAHGCPRPLIRFSVINSRSAERSSARREGGSRGLRGTAHCGRSDWGVRPRRAEVPRLCLPPTQLGSPPGTRSRAASPRDGGTHTRAGREEPPAAVALSCPFPSIRRAGVCFPGRSGDRPAGKVMSPKPSVLLGALAPKLRDQPKLEKSYLNGRNLPRNVGWEMQGMNEDACAQFL